MRSPLTHCHGLGLVLLVQDVLGHGAIVWPRSRNAVDGDIDGPSPLSPWKDNKMPYPTPFGGYGFCATSMDPKNPKNLTSVNGQACYWFSNGCSHGCDECDGITRGPIPCDTGSNQKACSEMTPYPKDGPGGRSSNSDPCIRKMDVCGKNHTASICASDLRTYNTNATCGGPEDYYYFAPWRAPGSAPVFDSCGVAGGRPAPRGGFGAQYYNNSNNKQGDHGSMTLKESPHGVKWKAGSAVEVSWAIEANHGGGYSYRLCKADDPLGLTEKCFHKTPLLFTGSTSLRWGGRIDGVSENITGRFVTDTAAGTGVVGDLHTGIAVVPPGSIWAKNPIPDYGSFAGSKSFQPMCKDEHPECINYNGGLNKTAWNNGNGVLCKCSGEWGPDNMEIVDQVLIPQGLEPGAWVLGFRWDCEESNQVWQSCSDVTIVA